MRKNHHRTGHIIRLGFCPRVVSGSFAIGMVVGFFVGFWVKVVRHREVGWATIRDKIIYGELHAAQAPAGLMVAVNCGLGCVQAETLTGLVLNLHGNAITLSQHLWREGVRDGQTLRRAMQQTGRRFTLGVVHNYSSHSFLLRDWLKRNGIHPERDPHIVVVPPPQMPSHLKAGHLDGYCVGEPWNSVATAARTGWTVATSRDLAPSHPEKVLMVRKDYVEQNEEEHVRLIAALLEACAFCDRPENREQLIATLAEPRYVGAPAQMIRASLGGDFDFGNGRVEIIPNFHVFHRNGANEPSLAHAHWVIRSLHSSGLIPDADQIPEEAAHQWFRADIFARAAQFQATPVP